MGNKWAISLPGTFPRLAPHTAALHALHAAYRQGLLESEPAFISTSSVAGIPGTVAVERSEEKFIETEERLINLRKRHFVSLNPQLKKNAAIDFLSIIGLLVLAHRAGKIENPIKSWIALAALAPPAYKISEKAVKDIFNAESFLVYDNLFKLLMKTFDFEAIFNSPIKIEIPAVNINKAGWSLSEILSDPPLYLHGWKNKGWVSVTNFRPEDINLDPETRNRKYVAKLINGLRVYGHFAPGKHDEGEGGIVDTAALSNLPVHFAINEGYLNIVVLHYNSTAEGPTNEIAKNWVSCLNRDVDITVSENTRKATLGYLRVNNDLRQLVKQMESLKKLEDLVDSSDFGEEDKRVALRHILETRESLANLSYAQKKQINFYFVGSDPLPNAHFSDFTQDQMIEGINIGWKAGWDAVPRINEMIRG